MDLIGAVVDGVKWGLTAPVDGAVNILGHKSSIIRTATDIFGDADNDAVSDLVNAVLRRSPDLIKPETLLEAGNSLICGRISSLINARPVSPLISDIITCLSEILGSAVRLVRSDVLLATTRNIVSAVSAALIATLGNLPFIQDAIFSNDINAATLGLIWSKGADLATFLVDLVECSKCFVPNTAEEWKIASDNPHGEDNELDLTNPMNRHAVICQLQRLTLSIIFFLEKMRENINTRENRLLGMTEKTTLATDSNLRQTVDVQLKDVQGDLPHTKKTKKRPFKDEKWLFVNGIAGEYHWTRLACEKLAKRYSRDITGVLNRGDGILWDLVECAGERSAQGRGAQESQSRLIQRTESSKKAQEELQKQLELAINQTFETGDGTPAYIIMIAHSQGCLLLRLALERLIQNMQNPEILGVMRKRLCIFTFGNPSVDWKLGDVQIANYAQVEGCNLCASILPAPSDGVCRHLTSYARRTEHFANEADFVAQLGVLAKPLPTDSGYDYVFVNENTDWKGHFFGSQYSLDSKYYRTQGSWLLGCNGTTSMQDVEDAMLKKPDD